MDKSSKFRVVIVGAGPVGLYMAHAMERADIDYVLLERRATVANPNGQLLLVWPHTARLFDQIGVYHDLARENIPMHRKKRVYGVDGTVTSWNRFWQFMEPSHGYPFLAMLRSRIIDILHGALLGKDSKIRTSVEVVGIEPQADGVRVRLGDGSLVEGSIVIGTDGVHSTTRQLMQTLSADDGSDEKTAPPGQSPMVASFNSIFGRASVADLGIEPGTWFESRGAGVIIQGLVGAEDGKMTFATIKPLNAGERAAAVVSDGGRRPRYSDADADEHAASIQHVLVCPGVTFGDVWARADRELCVMVDQEEGFVEQWYHGSGRVVLVGDAVHKSTSANGLGMTCGVHSAAVLANGLRRLLAEQPSPSGTALAQVFARYQAERQAEVRPLWDDGHAMVRGVTRRFSWGPWLWERFVLPWWDVESLAWGLLPSVFLVRKGQLLSYVPFMGKRGWVPWANNATM
ncbi:hypothetical protein MCOR02_011356 [Pyricularia oryzae]|uniref:FAD-binding domain-containing protein n=1 Tax=Pyricularia oryzae TaxID=318829 RepID=A0A4P7NCI8_PYROR|nr:hypothetical protein MCOR02_011356 [Pyricularia oryzae]QBZ58310.1 hypothetical protein PoMZ_03257 [Pyricularia oryzae]